MTRMNGMAVYSNIFNDILDYTDEEFEVEEYIYEGVECHEKWWQKWQTMIMTTNNGNNDKSWQSWQIMTVLTDNVMFVRLLNMRSPGADSSKR